MLFLMVSTRRWRSHCMKRSKKWLPLLRKLTFPMKSGLSATKKRKTSPTSKKKIATTSRQNLQHLTKRLRNATNSPNFSVRVQRKPRKKKMGCRWTGCKWVRKSMRSTSCRRRNCRRTKKRCGG